MADKSQPQELSEYEQLQLEQQRFQTELMREQVEKLRARKDQLTRNRREQAITEETNRRKVAAEQSACQHRKAGRGAEGIFSGSAPEYSVIKHTEPWGETYVKCTRCGKEWRDQHFMDRKLEPKKVAEFKKTHAREYREQMAAYTWAMNLPTDNSPSGGAIFAIERDVEYAARA